MISVRYVTDADRAFWFSLDAHLPESEYYRKVRDRQGYVISEDGIPAGLLRYNLFWDNTPFCTMLYLDARKRGQGFGRTLMAQAHKKVVGYNKIRRKGIVPYFQRILF